MEVAELKHPEGKLKLRVKTAWLRGLLVLGAGAGGSMALGLGVIQALAKNPGEGFGLLKAWGPWALIVGFVVWVIWKIVVEAISVVRDGMNAWVKTAEKGADAQTRTADALTKLADQGGRSAEEVKRLTVYAAQEFPCVYQRFDAQDAMLKQSNDALVALTQSVLALTIKLNEDAQRGRRDGR
jgi:hypothetical protein